MPSPNRFVLPNESFATRLRERPLALAAGALVCGTLLGGLLVYQPGGSPRSTAQTAETTGSTAPVATSVASTEAAAATNNAEPAAPTKDGTAAVDCDQQTWPHLSHECAERKRRSVRVISTDKLPEPVVSAIEAPPPTEKAPAPQAADPAPGNVASTQPGPAKADALPAPDASAPPAIATAPEPAVPVPPKVAATPPSPRPAAPTVAATPPPTPPPAAAPKVAAAPPAAPLAETAAASPAATIPTAAAPKAVAPTSSPPVPQQQTAAVDPSASGSSPTASVTADNQKDVGNKSKRKKAKSRDRSYEPEYDSRRRDSDQARDSDRVRENERVRDNGRTRESDRVRDSERPRGRDRDAPRIVERWIEREYDVPSDERSGRRGRVTVIARDRDNARSERRVEPVERRGDFFFGGGSPVGF